MSTHPILALTKKEREVAKLIADGFSNKMIAESLEVDKRTVQAHIFNACQKLGVSSRTQLTLVLLGRLSTGFSPVESQRTTWDKQNMMIISLRKQGLSPREIGRTLNVSDSRTYYVLKKNDLWQGRRK